MRFRGWRKFIGLMLATVLLFFGKLESRDWVYVFGVFVAGNAVEHVAKGGREND